MCEGKLVAQSNESFRLFTSTKHFCVFQPIVLVLGQLPLTAAKKSSDKSSVHWQTDKVSNKLEY